MKFSYPDMTSSEWGDYWGVSDMTGINKIVINYTIPPAKDASYSSATSFTYDGSQKTAVTGSNVTITGTNSATNAGSYTATVAPQDGHAWSDGSTESKSVSWSISPKSLAVPTLGNTDKTYTGSAQSPTVNGYNNNSSTMTQSGTASAVNAGTYSITWDLKNKTNYKWNDNSTGTKSATWSIAKKEVGLTWGNTSFTYDSTGKCPTATATGLVGSDTCTVSVSGSQVNVGTHTASADSLSNGNYKLPSAKTRSFIINKKDITITAKDQTITYGNPIATGTGQVTNSGLGTADYLNQITLTPSTNQSTDNGTITPSAAVIRRNGVDVTGNYNITYNTGKLTINKATPTPAVAIEGWTYQGDPNAPAVSGNPGSGEETFTYEGTANDGTSYQASATPPTLAGSYTVTGHVAETANYNAADTQPTSFTVARKAIAPVVEIDGWTYGDAANAPSLTEGSNPGEGGVTYAYTGTTVGGAAYDSADAPTEAGNYTVTASVAQTANYQSGTATADFTVARCPITVDVPAQSKTYGQTDADTFQTAPGAGFSLASDSAALPASGAALSGAIERVAGENVGKYDILLGTLASANPNYKITVNGTDADAATVILADGFTVNRKNVNDADVTFVLKDGAGNNGAGESGNEFTYNGEPVTLVPTLKMNYLGTAGTEYAQSGNFTLGNQYQKTALGEYYAEINGQGNFIGTRYLPWRIVKADISSVSAPDISVTYDGKPHGVTVTSSSPPVSDLTVQYRDGDGDDYPLSSAPTHTVLGNYTTYYKLSGDSYNDYAGSASVTITPRAVTVSAPSAEKVYGDTDTGLDASGLSFSGLAEGDSVSEADVTREQGENVGSYAVSAANIKIVNAKGEDVTDCYTFTTNPGTFTITPRPITVTAIAQGKVYGELDADKFKTDANGYEVGGRGLAGTDTLNGSLSRAEGEDAGTYAIQQNNITDDNNPNYTITYTGANFTIERKPLTEDMIVITPKAFQYDGNEKAPNCSMTDGSVQAAGAGIAESDYTVSGSLRGTSFNVYEVDFTGKGNYKGTVTGTWSISVVQDDSVPYDGQPHTMTPETPEGTSLKSIKYRDESGGYTLNEPPSYVDAGEYSIAYEMVLPPYVPGGADRTVTGEAVLTITPAPVTVSAKPAQSVYNENLADLSDKYEITGEVYSQNGTRDDLGVTVSTTVKKGDAVNAYDGAITVAISNPNYKLTANPATYTVTKRPVTATVSMDGWTYGDTAKVPTVSITDGDGTAAVSYEYSAAENGTYSAMTPVGAGTHWVRANIAESANYQACTTAAVSFTIAPKELTANLTATDKTYDSATNITLSADTLTGVVDSDDVSLPSGALIGAATSADAGNGIAVSVTGITLEGDDAGNYVLAQPESLTVNITPKPVTFTWSDTATFTYDGTEKSVTASVVGAIDADADKVTVGSYGNNAATNAGSYMAKVLTLGGDKAGNYSFASDEATASKAWSIGKADIALKANDAWSEYGAALAELTWEATSGQVYGQDDLGVTITTAATTESSAGTYPITIGNITNANYNLTGAAQGTYTVTKLQTAATIAITGWKYGEAANQPVLTRTTGDENASVTYQYKAKDADDSAYSTKVPVNAGSWLVRAVIAETTNYTGLTTKAFEFAITKRSVTLTSATDSKPYDGAALTDATVTVDGDGFADGEGATYSVTGTQTLPGESDNAFTYTLTGGAKADNYDITQTLGKLTVTDRTADGDENSKKYEITVTANSGEWTYDGKPHTVSGFTEALNYTFGDVTYTVSGLTASATATDAIEMVVEVTGTPAVTATINGTETDLTGQFIVNKVNGTLKINKRNVTLTSATDTKVYDGDALTNHNVTATGFVDGEGATYTVTGSQKVTGSSANTFDYALNDGTKTDNYNITKTEGTLTVTRRDAKYEISPQANSDSVKYDGQTHTVSGFVTDTFTVEGNAYTVSGLTATGTGTNAGDYTVSVSGTAVVTDSDENNVTGEFSVVPQTGTLTIGKRDVTLTSATKSKAYDGVALTDNTVTVSGDGFVGDEGATYDVTGTRTLVGASENTFTYNLNDNTNADNYNIGVSYGTLTVNNRDTKYSVTLTANSGEFKYDGTEKTVSGYTIGDVAGGGFTAENGLSYTISGMSAEVSGTDAKTYTVNVTGTPVIKDSDGNDVTDQFTVNSESGALTITKRSVTLTSATDSKTYDGATLTNDTVTIGGDNFADGEGATYSVTGTRTQPGTSDNVFTYALNDGTKAGNYEISQVLGTLTVTNRTGEGETGDTPDSRKYEITVTANSDTQTYDGTEHSVSGFETLEYTFNDVTYTVSGLTASASRTDAGETAVEVEGTPAITDADGNDLTAQFIVNKVPGKLTVNKRNVTLTSATDSKPYDGDELTNNSVEVGGDGFADGEGATYSVTGTRTLAGVSENAFTYTLDDGVKADNYNISVTFGALTVNSREAKYAVTLTANSGEYQYDGAEKSVEGYAIDGESGGAFTAENGQVYTIEGMSASGSGADAGTYAVNVTGTPVIKDSDGNDVTDEFAVNAESGTLTITKRNVTLTSGTASKVYDGAALTNDEVTVTGDGFVNGEGATYSVTGSRTLPGTADNTFIYALNDGTKKENYEIKQVYGALTITNRTEESGGGDTPDSRKYEITVTANSGTFSYDGAEHTVSGFETLEFAFDGVVYTVSGIEASASRTEVGETVVAVTGTPVVTDADGNDLTAQFIVNVANGTLTILSGSKIVTIEEENGGTITAAAPDGEEITVNPDGSLNLPGGTTIEKKDKDGNPIGESTVPKDVESVTVPKDKLDDVTVDEEGNIPLPGGTTIETKDKDGNPTTITAPEDKPIVIEPDGETKLPGGTTIETKDKDGNPIGESTIPEDVESVTVPKDKLDDVTVDEEGNIPLPGGTTIETKSGGGNPITITAPEDKPIVIEPDGETKLPGGTTIETKDKDGNPIGVSELPDNVENVIIPKDKLDEVKADEEGNTELPDGSSLENPDGTITPLPNDSIIKGDGTITNRSTDTPEKPETPQITLTQDTVTVTPPTPDKDYEYSIDDGPWQENPVFPNLNPGTEHTVRVREVAPDGTPGPASDPITVRTKSVPAYIVTAPTAKALVYTGEAQELIIPGVAVGGTILYRLTEEAANLMDATDEQYSTLIPAATNAGNYTVWYRVDGDNEHEGIAPQSIPVIIRKASQTAPEKGKGYSLVGAMLSVDTGTTNDKARNETRYELYDGVGAPITSGSYMVESGKAYYVRWGGGANYNPSPYTAIPMEISVTVLAYPVSMGSVAITGVDAHGKCGIGTSVTVTATPASGYEFVNWQASDETEVSASASYTFTATESVILTATFKSVGKRIAPAPAVISGLTYTGNAQRGVSEPEPAQQHYTWTGDSAREAVNAGTYKASAALEYGYVWPDGTEGVKTLTWIIDKARQAAPTGLEATDNSVTGTTVSMEYRAAATTGFTDVTGDSITGLVPGSYHVRFKEDANHYPGAVAVVTVVRPTISAATLQPSALNSASAVLHGVVSPKNAADAYVSGVGFAYRKAVDSEWISVTATKGAAFDSEISELRPNTDYVYKAVVSLTDGAMAEGKEILFHTLPETPVAIGKIEIAVTPEHEDDTRDVIVSIEEGNDVIASKDLGSFHQGNSLTASFESLPDGNYNIVVRTKDGDYTDTRMISIENGAEVSAMFTVPLGKLASVVEVRESAPELPTPKVAVEGLDGLLTDDDRYNAATGSEDVEVKLEVENVGGNAEGAKEIEKLDGNKVETFLDMELIKTVTELDGDGHATSIDSRNIGSENNVVMEIAIPYPNLSRPGIAMYRYHNAVARILTALLTKPVSGFRDGTYFVDKTGGYIFLYASGFSTYAIGFPETASTPTNDPTPAPVPSSGGGGGGGGGGSAKTYYTVTVESVTGGSAESSVERTTKGEKVTVTVKSDEGYTDSGVTVKTEKGKKVSVKRDADGAYVFTMPSANVVVTPTFAPAKSPVTTSEPEKPAPTGPSGTATTLAADPVTPDVTETPAIPDTTETPVTPDETGVSDWLITDEHPAYIKGFSDGTFRPVSNVTRAQTAMMFYRLLKDRNIEKSVSFNDMNGDEWYAEAVYALSSLGIIQGYSDGSFRGNDNITRAAFTAIATRFAKSNATVSYDSYGDAFSDVPETHWARDTIARASSYGWVGGYADGTFHPADFITRAAVTAIINRMLGRSADEAYVAANKDALKQFSDVQTPEAWYYYNVAEAANEHSFTVSDGKELWNG